MEKVYIHFPRNLRSDQKGIEFLCLLWGRIKKYNNRLIVFNLTKTAKLETNLISALGMIIKRILSPNTGNSLEIRLKDISGNEDIISEEYCKNLLTRYSIKSDNPALDYHFFDLQQEDEKSGYYLNNALNRLNLKHEKRIKKVISEIMANVKMHASPKEAAICGYYIIDDNDIQLSVCNMGLTIKQNIEDMTQYKFSNDLEAIEWAIKKSNSTRILEDTGGLGLYIIRKYLKQIEGQFSIVSGKGLIVDYSTFNNAIIIGDEKLIDRYELDSFFPGTFITVKFKLDEKDKDEKNRTLDLIDFEEIMEDIYGMFDKVSK